MNIYDPIILVTRGDELPKKNYEKKLHPTYETSIRLSNNSQTKHLVVKFFDQYRALHDGLAKMGIGYQLAFPIDAEFPPTHFSSKMGFGLSEDALQQRCYMLNKWMQSIFNNYHIFPEKAQALISEFLSLEDNDEGREKNKNYILDMIKKKNEMTLPDLIEKANGENGRTNSAEKEIEEAPIVLTPELLAEYSQPQILHTYLRAAVYHRYIDSRNRYETILEALSFDQLSLSNASEYDQVQYDRQTGFLPKLSIIKPFDGYRQLKHNLAEVGVFGRDKQQKIDAFNEDGSKPYRAYKVDAEFPKTYPKSSLGLGLNEEQLKARAAILNNWLTTVLRSYKEMNPVAQDVINQFLGINNRDNLQDQLFTSMLNGSYEAPKLPIPPKPQQNRRPSALFGGRSTSPQKPSSSREAYVPVSISAAGPRRAPPNVQDGDENGDNRYSEVRASAVSMQSPTSGQLSELQQETIIREYLAVTVTKGDMIAKKKDEGRKHHGYLTTVRLRYLDEIDIPDRDRIDPEAYGQLALLPAKTILKVFDGYRQLKIQLEERNVFSLEVKDKAKEIPGSVVIPAVFPRTYKRSSFGLSLGDNEIRTRTAELNHWMGMLLMQYPTYPSDAKDLINEFLQLDDSPAESENQPILQVLKDQFVPPYIPEKKKKGKNATSSVQFKDSEEEEEQDGSKKKGFYGRGSSGGSTEAVTQGCACIVM